MTGLPEAEAMWERAVETFEDAKAVRYPHSIANRAYYAAFYAVSAAFALDGIEFTKHKQVESAVHRDLVHTGRWSEELGKAYSALVRFRTTGDYKFVCKVTPESATKALEFARRILEAVNEAHSDVFRLMPGTPDK